MKRERFVLPAASEDHILSSDRLTFLPMVETDRELYCVLYTDDEVMQYIGKPASPDTINRQFSNIINQMNRSVLNYFAWTINDRTDGSRPGFIALSWSRSTPGAAEIGMVLGSDFLGKGFATESMSVIMQHGVSAMNLTHILASHHPDHVAAANLVKRLGYVYSHQSGDESMMPLCHWAWPDLIGGS